MQNEFFIRKVIYQTYECKFKELHPVYQENVLKWKEMHPDWELKYLSAEKRRDSIIQTLNLSKHAIQAYDKTVGITQSDMWRFAVTGKNGGMWADLDSLPTRSIDEFFIENPNLTGELLTTPKPQNGITNCANFIFSKYSYVGNELANIVYEHLEMSGFLLKNGENILHFDTIIPIWNKIIKMNQGVVREVLTSEWLTHSKDYKPPLSWLSKAEKLKPINERHKRTISPEIYTKQWTDLYLRAKTSLDKERAIIT